MLLWNLERDNAEECEEKEERGGTIIMSNFDVESMKAFLDVIYDDESVNEYCTGLVLPMHFELSYPIRLSVMVT